MYKNVGGKIKKLAIAVTIVGIISSIITGGMLMGSDDDFVVFGFIIMVVGSFFAWLSNLLLVGYGQLIENSDKAVALLQESKAKDNQDSSEQEQGSSVKSGTSIDWLLALKPEKKGRESWMCACGAQNTSGAAFCAACGNKR